MTTISRAHALEVIRRAYGHDYAESLADRLPERIDLHNPRDLGLLSDLGLTADGLVDALGGEL